MAMMVEKTPGVYINEIPAFPNSVVGVETAVPVFIGYTEKTMYNKKDFKGKAIKIDSFSQFNSIYGGPPSAMLTYSSGPGGAGAPKTIPVASVSTFEATLPSGANIRIPAGTTLVNKADGKEIIMSEEATIPSTEDLTVLSGSPLEIPLTSTAVALNAVDGQMVQTSADATVTITGPSTLWIRDSGEITIPADTPGSGVTADTDCFLLDSTSFGIGDPQNPTGTTSVTIPSGSDVIVNVKNIPDPSAAAPTPAPGDVEFTVATGLRLYLYDSLKMFFDNGGGDCFILSVGTYPSDLASVSEDDLWNDNVVKELEKQDEPTIICCPDGLLLGKTTNPPVGDSSLCYDLYSKMLLHCEEAQNKVAVMDIYNGDQEMSVDPSTNVINLFRNAMGGKPGLKFGAVYYPWVNTTLHPVTGVDYTFFDSASLTSLSNDIKAEVNGNNRLNAGQKSEINAQVDKMIDTPDPDPAKQAATVLFVNNFLQTASPLYKQVIAEASEKMSIMPLSAAMAGVYTRIDDERGVWKAPANTSIISMTGPTVQLTDKDQEDLNVPINGLAVNAIRTFKNRGTLIWGARTLDGNSNDNRYINVRRTLIYLEQSIKNAANAYVFEPNDAKTWTAVKSMIENFLMNVWKAGGLVGPSPAAAYDVNVGAATMTAQDILEGYMRVTVRVAISHPAEFIIITFQQKQQVLA